MNDNELRSLIRDAVARHLATRQLEPPGAAEPTRALPHPSHYQYVTLVNVGEACVIEPTVNCTHCGYCRCHGH